MDALLLHGAGAGGWEWGIWGAVLEARGIRVATPDLVPAAGGLAATSLQDYRRQAIAALAALPAPRIAVGASLGGLLALDAAAAVGCAALVLVNPLPPLPEATALPPRTWPDGIVPWRRDARFASTVRAMPDADAGSRLLAFRHWRDESSRVLVKAHAGIRIEAPPCPLLVIASSADEAVPAALSAALAARLGGSLLRVDGGHLSPVLGAQAVCCATAAVEWLNGLSGFTGD